MAFSFVRAVAVAAVAGASGEFLGKAVPSVCGDDPAKVADCEKPDFGSCGNACCLVELSLPNEGAADVYFRLKSLLDSKVDGTFGHAYGDDLRPASIIEPESFHFQFMLQGRHDAPMYKGENADILDFNIYKTPTGGSVLRMFSLSTIHGALGDNGQNYKNLAYLSHQLDADNKLAVKHGCGMRPASTTSSAVFSPTASNPSPSVCGDDPAKVADCEKSDMGSCGNACCVVELAFPNLGAADVYSSVKSLLESKVDGTYEYVSRGSPNPVDDLRPFKISQPEEFQFILQGRHSAPQYKGENADILDFAIYKTSTGGSVLRMFSLSRIHGALGDAGQNYKTLAYLSHQLDANSKLTVQHGCGSAIEKELQVL
ncbi:unnamed protein product [Polarella glacialis]|uniref:Uncharacterized protein n=1 Tax=Polarella glacialis TaxID=89957 RepID=A0A813G684_POLGL|nr:unnamed protein product [Polarella glacialis]